MRYVRFLIVVLFVVATALAVALFVLGWTPAGVRLAAQWLSVLSDGVVTVEGAGGRLTGSLRAEAVEIRTATLRMRLRGVVVEWRPLALRGGALHIPSKRKQHQKTADHARKAWDGRFREKTHRLVETFTRSVMVDGRLYAEDIAGSIAHCKTLAKAKILTETETRTSIRGLDAVKGELDRGQFTFTPHDEDIHMAIERRLTEIIGPLGGKLHTGRSRNDQVALDIRLYVRSYLDNLYARILDLQRALVTKAAENRTVMMPGYTHLQRAQPVLFAHHLLAYVEMLERDKGQKKV